MYLCHCWGSGSVVFVCFGPSETGSVKVLYGFGSGTLHQQAKKVRNPLISTIYDIFLTFYLCTVNGSSKSKKQKTLKKKYFCLHLVCYCRKKQDPYLKVTSTNPRIRIRMRTNMSRIRNTDFCNLNLCFLNQCLPGRTFIHQEPTLTRF
jgi:hypothetical protein